MNILVTGATGTLGRAVIEKLLSGKYDSWGSKPVILGISRDEQKQRLIPKHPNLTLKLADIRDEESIVDAIRSDTYFDYIFHFAALKCVDTLEDNRSEAYRTNVIGSKNIKDFSILGHTKMVMTSTDKAVYPINTYGITKALAERLVLECKDYNIAVCRYGNVLGSRGSILEGLKNNLLEKKTAYLTDERMTRFWMTLNQARDFVLNCAFSDKTGIQLPFFMKSAYVIDLISAVADILEIKDYKIEKIGIRPGEKLHECLSSSDENAFKKDIMSNDEDRLMTYAELRDLAEKALGEL